MNYPEMYPDEQGPGPAVVARTMFAGGVRLRQAETILERIGESSATLAACEIRALGGAMARVPTDATAFAHRHSRVMINVAARYDPTTSERSSTPRGSVGSRRSSTTATAAATRASWPTRARSACVRRTPERPGSGWPR